MTTKRSSGILLHLTSLPGEYGIGDLGQSAYDFINFLTESDQRYWQFLSIGPTNAGLDNSPYMSMSAFAGNPLVINPDKLHQSGLISRDDLNNSPDFSKYLVEFDKVISFKTKLFHKAYSSFKRGLVSKATSNTFEDFCHKEKIWLDDYALFMSLYDKHQQQPWFKWPKEIASYNKDAVQEWSYRLADQIQYYKFIQFCFFDQWHRLHEFAVSKGIALIGDIPFYVGLDSSDVWANQFIFKLNPKTFQPTHVAGVPPDYFSETGQRWGNPVYSWEMEKGQKNEKLYDWWQKRFEHIFRMVELIRIDHFRGFEASWQIPAREKTAINGRWIKGPDKLFFNEIEKRIGKLPIIAEDLGIITPAVEKLRDDCGFPGMKILQFAFDSDQENPYLPHNYETTNCVVYTGTHDNDTTVGWYLSDKVDEASKIKARRYANCHSEVQFNWDMIRLAYSSIADLAIIPLQDALGFGADCRMNVPSTCNGNWRWRVAPEFLTEKIKKRLADETAFYNRKHEEKNR